MKRRSQIFTFLLALLMVATFICISVVSVSAAGTSEGCGDGNHYSFSEGVTERKAATCTEKGYDKAKCILCGEEYNVNEYPATGHTLYSVVGTDSFVTKCRDCSYTKTVKIFAAGSELPSYEETYNNVKDNIINSWDGSVSPGSAVISRGATWAVANEEGNSYMSFENEPAYVIPSANGNTYWNFGLDDTHFMDEGKSVVQSFDVRLPEGKAHCGLTCQLTERTVSASGGSSPKNGDAYVNIDLNGNVQLNKNNVGYKLVEGEWTRIAVVYNIVDYSVTLYINGVNKGSCQLATKYEKFNYVRMEITRTQGAEQYIDLDNMFFYYGTEPYYITQATTGPVDAADIRFSSDDATYFTYKDVTQADGSTKTFLHKLGTLQLNTKSYSEFTLVDTDNDDVTDAMSFKRNPNAGAKVGAEGEANDTHFTIFDGVLESGTNTIHLDMKFNEVTGNFTMIQFRRVTTEKDSSGNYIRAEQAMVTYSYNATGDYGSIKFLGTEIYRVDKNNPEVELYFIDRTTEGVETIDVYINGKLLVDAFDYSQTSYGNISLNQVTYKMFNMSGDPATTANQVDILFYEIDVFNQEVIPSNYSGKVVSEVTVPGAEQTIVSFDENDSLGKLLGANSDKVPGGYVYSTVLNKSYLSLNKVNPASVVPGNQRYVMIDKDGNEVSENGIWVFGTSDFLSSGVNKFAYGLTYNQFDNVPVNADGTYNLSGYAAIKIRLFLKGEQAGKYKFGIHGNKSSGYYYISQSALQAGWNEITYTIKASDNTSLKNISFNFTGWSYGLWYEKDCSTCVDGYVDNNGTPTKCTKGDHYGVMDGLTVYIESIRLVSKNETLANTGYTTTGSPCTEHSYGDPVDHKADCDSIGYTTETCGVCGYIKTTVTDEAGHTPKLVSAECKKATCEADGYDTYQCSVCQIKYRVYSDKTLHNYVLKENPTAEEGYIAATCMNGGQDVYVCDNENCEKTGKTFVMPSETDGNNHAGSTTGEWLEDGNGKHYQVCECGNTINKGEHTSDTWVSENDAHHKVCTTCSLTFDKGTCDVGNNGTEATCMASAICGTCNNSFGPTAPDKHAPADVWSYENGKHWHACTNPDCDAMLDLEDCDGEATCIAKAKCSVCENEHGDKDGTNHDETNAYWSPNNDGTHTKICSCGANRGTEDCSDVNGTPATCAAAAICGTCNTSFGTPDASKHVAVTEWSYENAQHWHACTNPDCDAMLDLEDCDGVATCIAKAKCSVCQTVRGELVPDNHDTTGVVSYEHDDYDHWQICNCDVEINRYPHGSDVWVTENDGHYKVCEACDTEFAAEDCFGGHADCQNRAVCEVCEKAYGTVDVTAHEADGIWVSDGRKHWQNCDIEGCDAILYHSNCYGDYATCDEKAVCDVCGNEYGDLEDHIYDGDCDKVCNYCEAARTNTAAHTYQNSCDKTCDICRERRTITHTYKNACDDTCDVCFAKRTPAEHSGGTVSCTSGAICASCGEVYTEPTEHNYSAAWTTNSTSHWHECSCGAKSDEARHEYGEEVDGVRTCACGHYVEILDTADDSAEDAMVVTSVILGGTAAVGGIGVGLWLFFKRRIF